MVKIAKVLLLLALSGVILQAASQFSLSMTPGAVSGCETPAAGTIKFCAVTDGLYQSVNGGAYAKLGGSTASIPTSFKCNVVLTPTSILTTNTAISGTMTATACQ